MAPLLLFDLADIDLNEVRYDGKGVEAVIPHRGQMRLLDGVIWADDTWTMGVGYKDIGTDEFWVPGHIPGRPLFPGVLMLETSAQLASFVTMSGMKEPKFLGFTGADNVKFRGQVVPGDRLILLVKQLKTSPRRFVSAVQGLVDGSLVFEATVKAMAI